LKGLNRNRQITDSVCQYIKVYLPVLPETLVFTSIKVLYIFYELFRKIFDLYGFFVYTGEKGKKVMG